MRTATQLTSLGRKPEDHSGAVNIPPFRASTIVADTLEEYERISKMKPEDVYYGRFGTPTTIALEKAIAELEGGDRCVVTSSGVSAMFVAIISYVSSGDHILLPDTVYGPTRRFAHLTLKRMGVEASYYDPMAGSAIEAEFKPNTKLVFVESPGSLTFEVQDVPAIADVAHKHGALVAADNTWATPLHIRPFELGIDVSAHSATKYISGHSDLIMGCITVKEEHYKPLLATHRDIGACTNADEAWLALRGLRTMKVRMKQHQENADKLIAWLEQQPEVEAILAPNHTDCPGHEYFKRDFTGHCGLFAIRLREQSRAAQEALLNHMHHFKMGVSWGGYESLMIPFDVTSIRTATNAAKGTHLRIHAGLEDADDLIADLEAGFERLRGVQKQAA